MTRLINVSITAIDHNPFRDTDKYPFIEKKIDALMRSIDKVGLWEGVIAREVGNRYQLAFGHHRIEAARRCGLTEIPVIVRDLDDGNMLAFMGRENMEDYNSDFLTMLEAWEATWNWLLTSRDVSEVQAIEITKVLGWEMDRSPKSSGVQMNRTAEACNAARKLIAEGHVQRQDLADMTVSEAREILTRASANIDRIEKAGRVLKISPDKVEASKKAVSNAIKVTADESRAGQVSQANLRSRLDVNAYRAAEISPKVRETPLFEVFAKQLTDQIYRMLRNDVAAEKLEEIIKGLKKIGPDGDWGMIGALRGDLKDLRARAQDFENRLVIPENVKIVSFRQIEGTRK